MVDENKVLHALRVFIKASHAVNNALKKDMEKNNINPTEFMVLELLLSKEKLPVNDIAKKINVTSGSMTYVSNKLIEKGLIQRNQCTKDTRLFYLSLSNAGEKMIKQAFERHKVFINKLFAGFTQEELSAFANLNKKLGYKAEEV